MNNIISMSNWKTVQLMNDESRTLYREGINSPLTSVLYMYGNFEDGLMGIPSIEDDLQLASVEELRTEAIYERDLIKEEYNMNDDPLDYEVPWETGVMVCKEGVFTWSWDSEDYELLGKVHRTLRRKSVTFEKNFPVKLDGSILVFEQGSSYYSDEEYVIFTEEMVPVSMLVIKSCEGIPVTVPYDISILSVETVDNAVISDIEEPR